MDAKLVVIEGRVSKREVRLKLPTVIGRSRHADLTVNHAQVSREHCRIYELDGALVVRDNDSTNGTYVEGRRIAECVLRPGDRIRIGPLTFSVEYEHQGDFPVLDITKRGDHDATVEGAVPLSADTVQAENAPAAAPSRPPGDTVGQGVAETIGRPDRFRQPATEQPAASEPWPDFTDDEADEADAFVAEAPAGEHSAGDVPLPEFDDLPTHEPVAAADDPSPDLPEFHVPRMPAAEAAADTQTWFQPPPPADDRAALPPPGSAAYDEPADDDTDEPSGAEEPGPPSRPIVVPRAVARPGQPEQPPGKGLFGWLPFGKKKTAGKSTPPAQAPAAPSQSPSADSSTDPTASERGPDEGAPAMPDEPPVGSDDDGLDSFLRKLR